jgi:hypothetical protein
LPSLRRPLQQNLSHSASTFSLKTNAAAEAAAF